MLIYHILFYPPSFNILSPLNYSDKTYTDRLSRSPLQYPIIGIPLWHHN